MKIARNGLSTFCPAMCEGSDCTTDYAQGEDLNIKYRSRNRHLRIVNGIGPGHFHLPAGEFRFESWQKPVTAVFRHAQQKFFEDEE